MWWTIEIELTPDSNKPITYDIGTITRPMRDLSPVNRAVQSQLPFSDRQDFEDAMRASRSRHGSETML
jgi:hypothetical protein